MKLHNQYTLIALSSGITCIAGIFAIGCGASMIKSGTETTPEAGTAAAAMFGGALVACAGVFCTIGFASAAIEEWKQYRAKDVND